MLSLGEASAERTWCWQAGWDSCVGDDDFHTLHSGGCDTGEGGKSAGGAIEAGEAREDSQPEVGISGPKNDAAEILASRTRKI